MNDAAYKRLQESAKLTSTTVTVKRADLKAILDLVGPPVQATKGLSFGPVKRKPGSMLKNR